MRHWNRTFAGSQLTVANGGLSAVPCRAHLVVFAACAACLACWLMSRAFYLPPFANAASGGPSALCKALGVGRKGPPGGRRELQHSEKRSARPSRQARLRPPWRFCAELVHTWPIH